MTIRLGARFLDAQATYPGACVNLVKETLRRTTLDNAPLFGLAPQGVCLAGGVATTAGDAFTSPFHHRPRVKSEI